MKNSAEKHRQSQKSQSLAASFHACSYSCASQPELLDQRILHFQLLLAVPARQNWLQQHPRSKITRVEKNQLQRMVEMASSKNDETNLMRARATESIC